MTPQPPIQGTAGFLRQTDLRALNYFQLSYGIAHKEGQDVGVPRKLIKCMQQVNEQVLGRVRTGWSMFHVFNRDAIRPRTSVDPTSGKGDEDFVECSLLDRSDTGATDYWRVSRDGFATVDAGLHGRSPRLLKILQDRTGSPFQSE